MRIERRKAPGFSVHYDLSVPGPTPAAAPFKTWVGINFQQHNLSLGNFPHNLSTANMDSLFAAILGDLTQHAVFTDSQKAENNQPPLPLVLEIISTTVLPAPVWQSIARQAAVSIRPVLFHAFISGSKGGHAEDNKANLTIIKDMNLQAARALIKKPEIMSYVALLLEHPKFQQLQTDEKSVPPVIKNVLFKQLPDGQYKYKLIPESGPTIELILTETQVEQMARFFLAGLHEYPRPKKLYTDKPGQYIEYGGNDNDGEAKRSHAVAKLAYLPPLPAGQDYCRLAGHRGSIEANPALTSFFSAVDTVYSQGKAKALAQPQPAEVAVAASSLVAGGGGITSPASGPRILTPASGTPNSTQEGVAISSPHQVAAVSAAPPGNVSAARTPQSLFGSHAAAAAAPQVSAEQKKLEAINHAIAHEDDKALVGLLADVKPDLQINGLYPITIAIQRNSNSPGTYEGVIARLWRGTPPAGQAQAKTIASLLNTPLDAIIASKPRIEI